MVAKDYERCVAGGLRGLGISAARSSRWAYALRSRVCPARRQARRTASALLEVAMESALQEKCSYTMTVRGLLDAGGGGGAVTVRRMRVFVVEMKGAGEACRWRW